MFSCTGSQYSWLWLESSTSWRFRYSLNCEKDLILCFQTRPSMAVQLSVYLMIFGSGLAALNDLAFNLKGWVSLQNVKTPTRTVFCQITPSQTDVFGWKLVNSLIQQSLLRGRIFWQWLWSKINLECVLMEIIVNVGQIWWQFCGFYSLRNCPSPFGKGLKPPSSFLWGSWRPGLPYNRLLDMNRDLRYTYVLLNDFFTAGNGVLMKKKLESKDLGYLTQHYYLKRG